MKKKLLCFLGMLVAVLISTVMSSCEKIHDHGGLFSLADSTAILNIAQSVTNPEFNTPTEAQQYQLDTSSEFKLDSTFRAMTQKQIFDVTSVLIQRGIHPTVKQIANEFITHKDVYSNLPKEPQDEDEIPRADPVIDSSTDTVVDTVIAGEHVRLIKTKGELT